MNWFPLIGFIWRWAPRIEEEIATSTEADPVSSLVAYLDALIPVMTTFHPTWSPFLADLRDTLHLVVGDASRTGKSI